jgi:hypothetical protein
MASGDDQRNANIVRALPLYNPHSVNLKIKQKIVKISLKVK